MTNNIQSHIYYVYYYLRSKDSKIAKAGTPYYVGKGKGTRCYDKHKNVPTPKDKNRIVKIAENLTNYQAQQIEILHIAIYGRIDIGTGILRNRTKGGDGCGEPSIEARLKMGAALGSVWWNNGFESMQSNHCPGPGWIKGVIKTEHLMRARKNMQMAAAEKVKGTSWWTDGRKSVRSIEPPGPGWKQGSHVTAWNKGKQGHLYWWSNGKQHVQSYDQPGPEWFRSSPLKQRSRTRDTGSSNHKGTCWWTNGTDRKRSVDCPGEGWIRGTGNVTSGSKGLRWWNNGAKSIMTRECPGIGWMPGRL